MKKIYLLFATTCLSLSLWGQANSAARQDIITKVNGEEMKGKISRITDDEIYFHYTGETLEYTIKKSDVQKIVHSSGRLEVVNDAQLSSPEIRKKDEVSMSASPVDHHNKIAVLPFSYLRDNQPGGDEIGYKAQQDCYSFLSRHSAGYTILDPRTTNALLVKAGVTRDKLIGFTMKEICDILGVEYIIDGTVTQNKGYQTSYSGDNSSTTVKRDDNKRRYSSYSSSSSYAAQNYDVSVSLQIYMDNNAGIYNQSHKAFLANTDGSYSGPLEYLLKRCPLYKK